MKPKSLDKAGKKLVAKIDKEMRQPRLTESVREQTGSVGKTGTQATAQRAAGYPPDFRGARHGAA